MTNNIFILKFKSKTKIKGSKMSLISSLIYEYKSLIDLIQTNEILHLELYISLISVSIIFLITFLGLRYKKIQEIFSIHECTIQPKGFKETWKVYFSSPLFSANGICMWRIYSSIPLGILLTIYYDNTIVSFIIIQFYVFLFATDALDGAVARYLNNVTPIGKALDPLGDKILVLPILFIVSYYSENLSFLIITMFIILFDSIGQLLRGKTKNPAATWIGKTKTTITMITIYFISLNRYDVNLDYIGGTLLSISLIFTFWSFYGKLSPKMKSKSIKFLMRFIRKKVSD